MRDAVAGRVFMAQREAALDGFTDQLREASEVEVYVTSDELRRLLAAPAGAS